MSLTLPSPRAAVRTLLTGHPDGAAPWVRELGDDGDDGWFGPGSTIWAVHADAATLVGGIRALLVQAMHPVVLAGFDGHSDYREDPESRLQRTASFVTITTFGTSAQAEDACARVRTAHQPVRGATESGRPYDARDPELLGWVHLALVDSLAEAVRRFGRTPFDLDDYLAETAVVGERLGAANVPHDIGELAGARAHYQPELALTASTRRAHEFLLDPPLAARIRWPYRVIASAAVASLPPELRALLGARPLLPDPAARLVGRAATALLAQGLGPSPAATAAARRTAADR
ncbi:MAG: oxygenase MpaB family protein [Actinomycetes bacterium]